MNSNAELHAEFSPERSISTAKKRKTQLDPDAGKKHPSLKRRRKDTESSSSADIVALHQDEHLDGLTPLSRSANQINIFMQDGTTSEVPRSTPQMLGEKVIESNSSLAAVSKLSDHQGRDLSIGQSASNSGYESEDEGPETVSVAAGLLQSRQAAADVARAEETQASLHATYIHP